MDATKEIQADKSYSREFTANALTVSTKTLDREIKSGKIRAVQVSTRRKAIPGSEIMRILGAA
jgi:predicted site-specific integrase-resolvase